MSEADREWMDPCLAVFNCHVNDAAEKAKRAFVVKYGRDAWNKRIAPLWKKGIMSIFGERPDEQLRYYVDLVHAFVNEGVPRPQEAPNPTESHP